MTDESKITTLNPVSTGAKQTLFKPGQSGNPAGRPKGSRNKFGEHFVSAFAADFERHGISVIEEVRRENAPIYLKIASDLLPKETSQKIEAGIGGAYSECQTIQEIAAEMLDRIDLDEALQNLDDMRAALLAVASEQAQPVT